MATDLEPTSEPAERVAAILAPHFDAYVTLLYVFHPPAASIAAPYHPLGKSDEEMNAIATERSREELEERARALFGADVAIDVARNRDPADAILAASAVDLIVIGTHGRSGWQRIARPASVAERVVHEARCPVLVVPAAASGKLPEGSLVLVATDLSAPAERTSDTAALWARHFHGKLSLLHAYLPAVSIEASYGDFAPSAVVSATYAEPGRMRLEALSRRYRDCLADVELAPSLRAGREICAQAEARRADLVVLGCRRRASWKRRLLGSVSDTVLRHLDAPVLLVPLADG